MKKLKKLLLIVAISLVVLLVVVGLVVGLFLGKIVKTGMETVGPKVTQVSLKVDDVSLSLLSGSAKIKGLVIGNPEGYKEPQAISVGLAEVSIDPASLLSDKIVVKNVQVDAPEITFEGGLSGNNLSKIQQNVNDFVAGLGLVSTNAPAANTPAKPAGSGKKLQVDHFIITNAKVHGSLRLFAGKELPLPSLPLPDIELKDLGTGTNGISPGELVQKVLSAVTTSTFKAVGNAAEDLGKGATDAVKDAGKAAGEGLNKLGKGIGSLFGK